MPILAMSAGTVTSVWGSAFVRLPNGLLKPVQVGDKVKGGEHIITDDDGIVEISPAKGHPAVLLKAEVAPESVNKAIAGIEGQNPEDVPAAGVTGGADGALQPGLRVDRVSETVGASSFEFATAQAAPTVSVVQATDPRLLATATSTEPPSRATVDNLDMNEGAGSAIFTITLDKPSTQPVTISYATHAGSGGGATPTIGPTGDSGVFTAQTGTVTFQPGETSKTVSVTIVNDVTYEGFRTFNIQLGVVNGNVVLDKSIGVATVHDDGTGSHPANVAADDDRPHVAVVTTQVQTSEGGSLDFHFKLTHDSTTPTPLTLTLGSDADANGALAKLTALGLDVSSVTIMPMARSTPLLDHAVNAQIDDQGHITFAAVPAGTTDVIVHVGTLPDDGIYEGIRTVQLSASTLYDDVKHPVVMTGTITDDASKPYMLVLNGEPAVEGNPVGFNVVLTHPSSMPVTVKFALMDGTDDPTTPQNESAKVGVDTGTQLQYEDDQGNWQNLPADSQLTFNPGQTQLHLRVDTVNDQQLEGIQYVGLQATVVSGDTANQAAPASNQTAIIDHDFAKIDDVNVQVTQTDAMASSAEVFAWHFTQVTDAGGAPLQAVDTITHFHSQTPSAGGDVLDLRDLLQGENTLGGTGNLDQYLHFDTSGSNTVIHVAPAGDLDPVQAFNGPHNLQIVLKDVNLKAEFGLDPGLSSVATDQQIIAKLLQQGNLLVDHA